MNNNSDVILLEQYLPLIDACDGLTLSQICTITGLESSTIQNWVKRGFVPNPFNKKYSSRQLARILLINALRDCMKLESIGELMRLINGDTDDESDDIVSEEELYGYFARIMDAADRTSREDELPKLVKNVLTSYVSEKSEHYERLRASLEVMAYAYTAGKYKRHADSLLKILKENNDE